jgi:single-stranded-DNA-specific exonuclease
MQQKLGIDVIVTDHHLPHVEIEKWVEVQILPPAYEVINTKKTGETYPEKMLCGCATAWKVVCAILMYSKILIKQK